MCDWTWLWVWNGLKPVKYPLRETFFVCVCVCVTQLKKKQFFGHLVPIFVDVNYTICILCRVVLIFQPVHNTGFSICIFLHLLSIVIVASEWFSVRIFSNHFWVSSFMFFFLFSHRNHDWTEKIAYTSSVTLCARTNKQKKINHQM